jgi:RNA-binding, Nab2-type zinc finger
MPRGKNYVNQNKGMYLQAGNRQKHQQPVSEPCKYGAACNRNDCIYSHEPVDQNSSNAEANAPCMAYLAGMCAFTKGCRRRHPPDAECERLVAKYNGLPCRFGPECRTQGCLYNHDHTSTAPSSSTCIPVIAAATKPTPAVSKTGASLAAWMPTYSALSSSTAAANSSSSIPTPPMPQMMMSPTTAAYYPPPPGGAADGEAGFPPPMMMPGYHPYPSYYEPEPYGGGGGAADAQPWYPPTHGPPVPPPFYGGYEGGGPPPLDPYGATIAGGGDPLPSSSPMPMIGSWKPAPIAAQPHHYASSSSYSYHHHYPHAAAPVESQFPGLSSTSTNTSTWDSEFPALTSSTTSSTKNVPSPTTSVSNDNNNNNNNNNNNEPSTVHQSYYDDNNTNSARYY